MKYGIAAGGVCWILYLGIVFFAGYRKKRGFAGK